MRTSGGRGLDGIPRQPSEVGFTIFGMNAIGLDDKVLEQECYFDVKQMYEFLDVRDLFTTYIKSSDSFTQVLPIFFYCQYLEISMERYASTFQTPNCKILRAVTSYYPDLGPLDFFHIAFDASLTSLDTALIHGLPWNNCATKRGFVKGLRLCQPFQPLS